VLLHLLHQDFLEVDLLEEYYLLQQNLKYMLHHQILQLY
jgi:hypothetical protein